MNWMVLHYNIGSLFSFFRFSLLLCVTVLFIFCCCLMSIFAVFFPVPYCLFKASHLQHSLNFKVTIYSRFNGRFLVWWMLYSEITRNLLHVINLVSKMVFFSLLLFFILSLVYAFIFFSFLYIDSIHYFVFFLISFILLCATRAFIYHCLVRWTSFSTIPSVDSFVCVHSLKQASD